MTGARCSCRLIPKCPQSKVSPIDSVRVPLPSLSRVRTPEEVGDLSDVQLKYKQTNGQNRPFPGTPDVSFLHNNLGY